MRVCLSLVVFFLLNRLLKFAQPSTPAEQREKMTASPDEQ
jgi:hypothetical protein